MTIYECPAADAVLGFSTLRDTAKATALEAINA